MWWGKTAGRIRIAFRVTTMKQKFQARDVKEVWHPVIKPELEEWE